MSTREWKRIKPEDKVIVEEYTGEIPVRLGALAKNLGIQVKLSSLPANCSGLIHKLNGKYEIKVNRNESRERQRFTLAHEISHYLLHREIIDALPDGIRDNVLYRSGASQQAEYEANRLAAELVMPKSSIEKRLQDSDGIISEELIELLAREFQVSKAAMEIRVAG